jgi:hypothetical protein
MSPWMWQSRVQVAAEVIRRTKASLMKESVRFVTREGCWKRKSTAGWLTTNLEASISTYFLLPSFWQPSKPTSITLRKESTTFLRKVLKHYRDFGFSQRYWRLISYVTWCVAGRVFLDVTQNCAALVFRIKQSNACLTVEMKAPKAFENSETIPPTV